MANSGSGGGGGGSGNGNGGAGGSGIVIVSYIPYVTGQLSSTTNDVALFADTSGTVIKDGGPLGSATAVAYSTSGNITIGFNLGAYAAIGLTGNASFSPSGSSGIAAGRTHTLDISNTTGGSLALTWNSSWQLANNSLPTSLPAGAYLRVVLFCSGVTETSIIASQFSATTVIVVANRTALRAIGLFPANTILWEEGYASAGDGGGGPWLVARANSTTVDNDGTLVVPGGVFGSTSTDMALMRLDAVFSGGNANSQTANLKWFGGHVNGMTGDCRTAMTRAAAAVGVATAWVSGSNYSAGTYATYVASGVNNVYLTVAGVSGGITPPPSDPTDWKLIGPASNAGSIYCPSGRDLP